ncbi:type II toxin-antitoxin system RatA family toxin [Sphingomonas sp.]|uniref:type II toxin-antitoxin system RatA family toxin n=1 Tax=Sphingomonas sp. TaxID=28214 RepID=UPI003B00582E
MPRHAETRRLPYTPEQMFDLVADVGRYGEFLPWVSAVRVRSQGETELVAEVVVGFKGLSERFTSRVAKERPQRIHVEYVDGPLEHLRNIWRFRADGAGGTCIDFSVDFAFRSRIFQALAGQVFDRALRKMIGAFEARAAALYGSPSSSEAIVAPGNSSSSAQSAA